MNITTPRIQEKMALHLESVIDRFDEELKPITFFIFPGGSIEAASIHVTRSIARRAETAVAGTYKKSNDKSCYSNLPQQAFRLPVFCRRG